MARAKKIMGVDIGGTGIKAAIVDVNAGKLLSDRVRLETPQPATPRAVVSTIKKIQKELDWSGPIGCGFPGSIKEGVVHRAPNLDKSWVGYEIVEKFKSSLKCEHLVVGNDADAAGLAELLFGAAKDKQGTVMLVTLGTGIGTALFYNGQLVPNTELGHLEMKGKDSEKFASNSAREEHDWSWKKWSGHVDRYLSKLEYYLGVDLFVIGGGVSKKPEKFIPRLEKVDCEVVAADMGNLAGIIGAASLAK
jgi:polyphosphate glucokinase